MVFTVEERDRIRAALLEMARRDARVVAGAEVGSLALGGGDRWSDLDLTFGLADGTTALAILDEWTPVLEREFGAVSLFDVPYQTSLYRVFLFPGHLQVDLSFTPATDFGAIGPKFRMLWGEAVERDAPAKRAPRHLLGTAVHHALRARFSIERGLVWQAQFWIGQVRDEAVALACLKRGLPHGYYRGADSLPSEVTAAFEETLVRSLDRGELMRALGVAIQGLLREATPSLPLATRIEASLRALASEDWSNG